MEIPLPKLFAEISQRGQDVRYEAGALLWREGEAGDSVLYVIEGSLAITDRSPDGETVVLRNAGPGHVIGEIAAYDGRPRSASVRACTESRVIRISSQEFRKLIEERPDILAELYWVQVDRVRSLTTRVTRAHQRTILDRLTRLYNYGFFRERLSLEMERARASGDSVALVMIDVDNIRHINDRHGRETGNRALAGIADILRGATRRGDFLVRYGGEELAVLLYGATLEEARTCAEAVRQGVEERAFEGGETQPGGRLTISAGVAVTGEGVDSDEALIRAADRALFLAKEAGRNRVVVDTGDAS
jgi:diguanylate cyclase (GGDEF)-like protein